MSTPLLSPATLTDPRVHVGWPDRGAFGDGSVVTLGVFDGFHRGHEALAKRALGHADRLKVPAVLVTFSPHPLKVLAPGAVPRQLMSLDDRVTHALSLGIDAVVVLPFTASLAMQSAADFVAEGLVDALAARRVVVGANFRCGRGGEGDVQVLSEMGRRHGFTVEALGLVQAAGSCCSSTEVRRRLAHGDLDGARELLGRDDDRVLVVR